MTDRLIDRLAVTGTDTGVGKTVVACALAARARQRGLRVAVMKPVESGIDVAPTDGTVRSDAERLRAAAGSTAPLDLVRPFVYDEPLAPMIAAARSGRPVVMAELDRCRAMLEAETDVLLVEGAGGILVPLDVHTSYVDLFVRWQTGVVVVAGNRLGVLNHTLLTVRAIEAARSRPDVDSQRIALTGGSQGGGITIAAAALDGKVAFALPDVPFLCHFQRAVGLTSAFPYQEIVAYLHTHRDAEDQVFNTLAYFDGIHFARRFKAESLWSTALMDEICPPSTVFAAYNAAPESKAIHVYRFNGHEGGDARHTVRKLHFLRERWG